MGVRCGVELEEAATASDEHATMRVRRLPPAPAPAIADDLYHAAGMFMTSATTATTATAKREFEKMVVVYP